MKKLIATIICVFVLTIFVASIASADEGDDHGAFVIDDTAAYLGTGWEYYFGLPADFFPWPTNDFKLVVTPSNNVNMTLRWIMPYSAGTQVKLDDVGICSGLVEIYTGGEVLEASGYFHVSPDEQEMVLKCKQ